MKLCKLGDKKVWEGVLLSVFKIVLDCCLLLGENYVKFWFLYY